MLIGFLWIVISIVISDAAGRMGRSQGAYLAMALCFSPLAAYMHLSLVGKDEKAIK